MSKRRRIRKTKQNGGERRENRRNRPGFLHGITFVKDLAEQSLKEFYDSLIGASTNWHKIEYNWRAIACVFAFAVSGLYTFSGAVAGSFGHNILWLVIFSVTDPTALILIMSVLTEEICL